MKETNDLPSTDEDAASDNRPAQISRRNILVGTAAAAAATGLAIDPALALPAKHAKKATVMAQSPMDAMAGMDAKPPAVPPHAANLKNWHQTFLEPQVISATRLGALEQSLNVGFSEITITTFDSNGNPTQRTQCVRSYNGKVPGTTFRVLPGDRLTFTVNNQLPKNEPAPPPGDKSNCMELMDKNFPGCFNTTNLHLHGLHVSPKTGADGVSSDDVLIKIPPAGDPPDPGSPSSRKYCVQLPTFHAPGTHWYHAHVHGATGIQVVNGLAGAIIVDEPDDQKIPADREYIWMVQEVIGGLHAPGSCANISARELYLSGSSVYGNMSVSATDSTKPYGSTPPEGVGFTVNSLSSPSLTMQPNEIQRWRVINATATPRGIFNFALLDANGKDVSQYLYLIAVDGITFYGHAPQQVASGGWDMAPGNRADFLVSIPVPGTYKVWRMNNSASPGSAVNQILAIIDVAGPSMPQRDVARIPLPGWDKAPCYLLPIEDKEINVDGTLDYDFKVLGGYFGGFTINGQPYGNSTGVPPSYSVKLGDVRRSRLVSSGNHPYHIHVNPFQVEGDKIDPKGPDDPSNWRFWDTILVPAGAGGALPPVNIRSRYLNYDGNFVIHCHILIHEDAGMMWNFNVQADPANGYPPVAPCTPVTQCQKGRPPGKASS